MVSRAGLTDLRWVLPFRMVEVSCMKKFICLAAAAAGLFGLSLLLTEVGVGHALAQSSSGQCNNIQNSDRRSLCKARAQNNIGYCSSIENNDLRSICRAEVSGNSGYCSSIENSDMRSECRAMF